MPRTKELGLLHDGRLDGQIPVGAEHLGRRLLELIPEQRLVRQKIASPLGALMAMVISFFVAQRSLSGRALSRHKLRVFVTQKGRPRKLPRLKAAHFPMDFLGSLIPSATTFSVKGGEPTGRRNRARRYRCSTTVAHLRGAHNLVGRGLGEN